MNILRFPTDGSLFLDIDEKQLILFWTENREIIASCDTSEVGDADTVDETCIYWGMSRALDAGIFVSRCARESSTRVVFLGPENIEGKLILTTADGNVYITDPQIGKQMELSAAFGKYGVFHEQSMMDAAFASAGSIGYAVVGYRKLSDGMIMLVGPKTVENVYHYSPTRALLLMLTSFMFGVSMTEGLAGSWPFYVPLLSSISMILVVTLRWKKGHK